MREDYQGCKVKYAVNDIEIKQTNCFSSLEINTKKNDKITIFNTKCKPTIKYTEKYLEYITKMLNIKRVDIEKDTYSFIAYECTKKNLLVCTLVRMLWEKNTMFKENVENYFIPLFTKKSVYRNKLKRYFDIVSKEMIEIKYESNHNFSISKNLIKTTKDFEVNKITSVQDFFKE